MPLLDLSTEEAMKSARNRASLWPDGRAGTDRFAGVVTPAIAPGFSISKEDRFFTVGSCFARNVERRLDELGFDVPLANIATLMEDPRDHQASVMNKYTVQSMANELRWAAAAAGHRANRAGRVAEMADLLIEDQNGMWIDPHFHGMSGRFDRVKQRRERFEAVMRTFVDATVFIFTLGLGEAWYDTRTELYLNQMPPLAAIRRDPDRFRFRQLSYDEIVEELEEIHAILTANVKRDFKVLITVSPVPFKRSFSGDDALIANAYSKSVQRAAAEALKRAHDNVDYFPSYEMVTLSNRDLVWETDNIHPTDETVDKVMNLVVDAYSSGTVDTSGQQVASGKPRTRPMDCVAAGFNHVKEGDFLQGAVMLAGVLDLHAGDLRHRTITTATLRLVQALIHLDRKPLALARLHAAVATLKFTDSDRKTIVGLYRDLDELSHAKAQNRLIAASKDAERKKDAAPPETALAS